MEDDIFELAERMDARWTDQRGSSKHLLSTESETALRRY